MMGFSELSAERAAVAILSAQHGAGAFDPD